MMFGNSGFRCQSADFDGSADYMLRGADLTGIADGKKGLLSYWVRLDGGDGSQLIAFNNAKAGKTFVSSRETDNKIYVVGRNAATTDILNIRTNATYTASAAWLHVLSSWDLATVGARHLYINDVSDLTVTTFTNDTIDYAAGAANWGVGGNTDGTNLMNGCLAEIYFDPTTYLDLSVTANRRLFIDATGKPVYLGATGQQPTGTQSILYITLPYGSAASAFNVNAGSGGNFTITGSLDLGSTSPSYP